MDLLQTSTQWLSNQFQAFASEPITYTRGEVSLTFNATAGRTEFLLSDSNGVGTTYVSRDWIFPIVLLATLIPVTPQRGDTVTNSAGEVFGVMLDDAGKQPYSVDIHAVNYRVHTKKIG